MNNTKEALEIWSALKPMIVKTIDERTKSCIRSKKMRVITAPNGSTIGVREPFDTVTYNIPYSSSLTGAVVGDTVWVQWYYDNASTMIAMSFGDGDTGFYPECGANMGNDLNNATTPGVYSYNNSYSHVPTTAGGSLIVVRHHNNQIMSQLAFSNSSGKNSNLYTRHYYTDGWGDWHKIAIQTSGTWTPQLYDYTTFVRNLGDGSYLREGDLVVANLYLSNPNLSGVSTMIEIRNTPMTEVWGGSVYFSEFHQTLYTHPTYIQASGNYVYFRPNIKSSDFSNASTGSGTFQLTIFGKA